MLKNSIFYKRDYYNVLNMYVKNHLKVL